MTTGGETADQMTRMTLQGIEVAAEIAMKAGGGISRSLAATLYTIITDKKKVKGKTRLDAMLKSGKELKVFAIRHSDLKKFCEEAKRYGVLYSVLKEKNNTDGICDIMVRAEDASKISRIVDKFELATIDTKAIRESIMNERQDPLKDIPLLNEKDHDELVKTLMASTKEPEPKKKEQEINPTLARAEKKKENQSERFSKRIKDKEEIRPSVREKLKKYKKKNEQRYHSKQPTKSKQKSSAKKGKVR